MVDQATMNDRREPPTRVRESLSDLAHDAVTLAELQVQLLSVDLRDARRGAGPALSQLIAGTVLALGSVPILLLAAAHVLVATLQWPPMGAYALVGAVAALLAAVLVGVGWRQAMRAAATVQRSRSEFMETLRWFKQSLRPSTAGTDADHGLRPTRSRRS